MANSLTSPKYVELSEDLNAEHNVVMLNPLSNDLEVMRQSLLFSGLEAVSHNINRKRNDLKLFEFGKTYHQFSDRREEHKHLSLFVTGNKSEERWNSLANPSDFFYLKGIVETVLQRLGLNRLKSTPTQLYVLSEGVCLSLGKKSLVNFGLVKKSVVKHFGISQNVLFADLNWDNV